MDDAPRSPADLDEPDDGPKEWPSPLRAGTWVDEAGNPWRLRGRRRQTAPKRVERLLLASSTRVLLFYGPDAPRDIEQDDRAALWERVRPYLTQGPDRLPGGHTDFGAGEFKDEDRHSILIIERSC